MSISSKGYKPTSVFQIGPNLYLNACVGLNGGPYNTFDYSVGYFKAAEKLVDQVRFESSDIDLLIYPIIYLYRHGIELGIKSLVKLLPPLWGVSINVEPTHRLHDNWNNIKPYLMKNRDFDPEDVLIQGVEDILNELTRVDPSGEVFRFHYKRSEVRHTELDELRVINIDVFAEAVEYVRSAIYHWHSVINAIKLKRPQPKMPVVITMELKMNVVQRVIYLAKELYNLEYLNSISLA